MAADYRKFMTPIFEIEIGDPNWNRRVKLPDHILRLVSKIEISENMMVDDNHQPSMMTIVFIEGSREPASPDYKMGTAGLYQIPVSGDKVDMAIAGSLTNRSGVITDLRFSGNSGITFLTEEEKKTGKVDNKSQKNVQGKNVTRKIKSEPSAPMFLFQQRNLVKVTWGYAEDPKNMRSMMLGITAIASSFPESGMPTTTITCSSSTVSLNQIASKDGKIFAKRIPVNKNGTSLYIFEDLKTEDLLQDLAKKTGMKAVISKNLLSNTVDKDKPKMLVAGESPHQFFMRLAKASGCYYEILPNPKTGVDTLYFISKKDMESRTIFKDRELLNWKGQGSILRSVSISADFSGLIGASEKGVDQTGENQSQDSYVGIQLMVNPKSSETNRKQELIPADPTKTNPHPTTANFAENILDNNVSGTVNYSPANSSERLDNISQARTEEQNRLVMISFSTVGYTKLMPGVVEINGIGVRYSGKYRLINVTHTIDASGYITKCEGNSSFLGAGGVKVPEVPSMQDPEDPLVDSQLFTPLGQYLNTKNGR